MKREDHKTLKEKTDRQIQRRLDGETETDTCIDRSTFIG